MLCDDNEAIELEHERLTHYLKLDALLTREIKAKVGDVDGKTQELEQVRASIRKGQHYFYIDESGRLRAGLGCF